MKIKDGIRYAAEALMLTAVATELEGAGTGENLSGADARDLSELVAAAHAAVREIAAEHAQVIADEETASGDGMISYESLSEHAIEVKEVRVSGKAIEFRPVYGGVKIAPLMCAAEVRYAYLPIVCSVADAVVFDNPRIDARILGMGIAAEYCVREGMTDEAVLWDARFKDALQTAKGKRREIRVRARKWR